MAVVALAINTPKRQSLATTLQQITVPIGTKELLVKPGNTNVYVAYAGTDGGAIGTEYITVNAYDSLILSREDMPDQGHRTATATLYLAGAAATTVELLALR